MKIKDLKVFIVGNPPPGWGGRYFTFVKLTTDNGISGIGECYGATFGAKAMTAMIEDTFQRYVEGMNPFEIEKLWRKVYGSGYTLRPDVSLMGVLSGLEIALWDIKGKALGQPVYNLLGGKVHERLRSYTYIYPDESKGQDSSIFWNAEQSAERAAQYVKMGFTGIKFDPAAPYSSFDPRQPGLSPSISASSSASSSARPSATGRPAVRHARTVHGVGRYPFRQEDRTVRSSLVRGTDATGKAGGNGVGRTWHINPRRHWRAAHHEIRVRPCVGMPCCIDPANGIGPRRRPDGGKEDRSNGGGALCPDRAAPLCGTGGGGCQHPLLGHIAELPHPRKHRDLDRLPLADSQEADPLGGGLCDSADRTRLGIELNEEVALAHPYTGDRLHLEMTNEPVH